jgi:hypothetical protein
VGQFPRVTFRVTLTTIPSVTAGAGAGAIGSGGGAAALWRKIGHGRRDRKSAVFPGITSVGRLSCPIIHPPTNTPTTNHVEPTAVGAELAVIPTQSMIIGLTSQADFTLEM